MIFLDIFVFESQKKLFSTIFPVFGFVLNFRDFSVFSISPNLPLSFSVYFILDRVLMCDHNDVCLPISVYIVLFAQR